MNWEEIPCRHCGIRFENLYDRNEHERCHVGSDDDVDDVRDIRSTPITYHPATSDNADGRDYTMKQPLDPKW